MYIVRVIYSVYALISHVFIENNTLTYPFNALIIVVIGYFIIIIQVVMDSMYFVCGASCCAIYTSCWVRCCVSNGMMHSVIFDIVIAMIYSGNSHTGHFMNIFTIFIHNIITKTIYHCIESICTSIITISIGLSNIFITVKCIVIRYNDGDYTSFYNFIYAIVYHFCIQ